MNATTPISQAGPAFGLTDDDEYRPDAARRQVLLGGAMLATAAASATLMPRRKSALISKGALDAAIPARIGPWFFRGDGDVVLPPQDELTQRIFDEVVTRVYFAPSGPPIMLLIAYGAGQTGMFQVHRPEVCYSTNGFKVGGFEQVSIPVAPGKMIEGTFCTAAGTRMEQILYWTRVDQSFPTDSMQERLAVIGSNLRGRLPDGLLVRTSVVSPDRDQSLALLKNFADAFAHSLGPVARRVMTGAA